MIGITRNSPSLADAFFAHLEGSSPMDPLTIGLFALVAVMIFFMFRNSRKRKAEAEAMQAKMVPGAEVMTQHGIYGTLISIDDDKNEAIIETTPGTLLRVHRQTVSRIVEPDEAIDEDVDLNVDATDSTVVEGAELNEDHAIVAGEPEFGERSADEKPKRVTRKKAAE